MVSLCLLGQPSTGATASFSCGVASGDVTQHGAVIWTRADGPGRVRAQIAADKAFADLAFQAEAQASEDADFTIRFEVDGLVPATRYYYRFINLDEPQDLGPVGTFRTAPDPDQALGFRLVLSGDSDFFHAPFHVLSDAAAQEPDLFLFFGDTIYADVPAGDLGVARTLSEYRAKYLQNRSDDPLRSLLAEVPVLVGWDDHEVANDYSGGEPGPDLTPEQIEAGYQAFFEYMPIRRADDPQDPFRTYRSIRYGSLAEFFLLDGRQYRAVPAKQECGGDPDPFDLLFGGRKPDEDCLAALSAPRTYLGRTQLEWVKGALAASTATHKFVVTDQPMSFLGLMPYDRWDGYDAERRELLEFIDAHRIENVWLLSTDVHLNAFNPDLTSYFREQRSEYRLDNGVVVREIVAGPIAADTLRSGALQIASAILGPLADRPLGQRLLDAALNNLIFRIARANRWAFWEPDRFAYAFVDVSPDDGVTVVFRGYDPAEQDAPPPNIRTLYDSARATYLPCWLVPVSAMMLSAMLAACALRGRRTSSTWFA